MNKARRIGAIIGLILLCSMYAITLVSSIFATPYAHGLFLASTFSTIVIPIMIWLAITVYQWVHKNDPDKNDYDTNDNDQTASGSNGTDQTASGSNAMDQTASGMDDIDKTNSGYSEPPESQE